MQIKAKGLNVYTALGKETPENRDKAREGKDVVRLLAQERSRS
jgi:hypothetical protein